MEIKNLVLGAGGHLGNNLLRQLLSKGYPIRASVRKPFYTKPFENLDCEIVFADFLKRDSLAKAMHDIDTCYITAAVYKSWSQYIDEDIIYANIMGIKNIIETAIAQNVQKLIYVSSTFTLDHRKSPMDESGWNDDQSDPYTYSKTEAEKLALDLAKKNNLNLISIVPSGMIGPNSFNHLTPTMEFLYGVLNNKIPFDPQFKFNFVDIKDVAAMMIKAAEIGRPGERYIIAQNRPITSTEIFELASGLYPGVKIPPKRSFKFLYTIASIMEIISKVTSKKPLLLKSQVKKFSTVSFEYDTIKSRQELGFNPKPQIQALRETFEYLKNQHDQLSKN